jgi:two-component system, sensor histidine kinase and response regulator
MSHEIRTPMHAILGLTEILRRETRDDRARERLPLVAQVSDHLPMLVDNVLDISKIESGKFELAAVEMRIDGVFARVLAMLHDEARRKGLALAGEIDADAGRRVVGDPTRLVQAPLNFAGEAIEFTAVGSVTLRCRRADGEPRREGMYRFEVEAQLDGIGATQRIRRMARYRDTPIVAPTADAFSADRERFLGAGMSDHLAKPVMARQLYAALVHWLQAQAPA